MCAMQYNPNGINATATENRYAKAATVQAMEWSRWAAYFLAVACAAQCPTFSTHGPSFADYIRIVLGSMLYACCHMWGVRVHRHPKNCHLTFRHDFYDTFAWLIRKNYQVVSQNSIRNLFNSSLVSNSKTVHSFQKYAFFRWWRCILIMDSAYCVLVQLSSWMCAANGILYYVLLLPLSLLACARCRTC